MLRVRRSLPIVALFLTSAIVSPQSTADEVIPDDLIIDGSLCVGTACTTPPEEDFGFDTIRVKGPDPLLDFVDTSTSASFPTNDWSMGVANTGANGVPQFFIRDDSNDSVVMILQSSIPGEQDSGGVALGTGSILVPGAISVGGLFKERRVVFVQDGVADSDAATWGQIQAVVESLTGDPAAQLESDRAAIDTEIVDLQQDLSDIVARLSALETALGN